MAKRFKCSPHLTGQAHAFPPADAAEPELRVVVFIVVVVVVEPQPTADAKEEADHQRRRRRILSRTKINSVIFCSRKKWRRTKKMLNEKNWNELGFLQRGWFDWFFFFVFAAREKNKIVNFQPMFSKIMRNNISKNFNPVRLIESVRKRLSSDADVRGRRKKLPEPKHLNYIFKKYLWPEISFVRCSFVFWSSRKKTVSASNKINICWISVLFWIQVNLLLIEIPIFVKACVWQPCKTTLIGWNLLGSIIFKFVSVSLSHFSNKIPPIEIEK